MSAVVLVTVVQEPCHVLAATCTGSYITFMELSGAKAAISFIESIIEGARECDLAADCFTCGGLCTGSYTTMGM